ncbi:MAG: flagellar basal body P-ring protein FlgI [Deltaproteobacteria bacterium]|nr:flagellar basal body P-ring protein FlgI [Deltaproteobacteria bacterium]
MKLPASFLPARIRRLCALVLVVVALVPGEARAEKLRELVTVAGARDNQLIGYGVVTGLNRTGDDITAPIALQSTLAMLRRLGVQIDGRQLQLRNIAAVMVTATIPAFAKPGTRLDVTVSSIGNARSLEGGVLLQTVLKGADRRSYAVAQGSMVVGGFAARGKSGSSITTGSVTSGRIPEGALVERDVPASIVSSGKLTLALKRPSFTLASRIAKGVENLLGEGTAVPTDGGSVTVTVPAEFAQRTVDLIADLEDLEVKPQRGARVVVSERTQTIVAGGDVRLAPVAIVHGNLTIVVREEPQVSQPVAPVVAVGPNAQANAGGARTAVVPNSTVEVQEARSNATYIDGAASLADIASALGALGLSARELISVLQALKAAGALEAQLEVE